MSNMYDNKGFGTPNAINSMAENPMAKKAQDKGSSVPTGNIAELHEHLRNLPDYALAKLIGSGQPQGLEAMLAMLVAGERGNRSTVQAPPPGEKTMAEQAIASLGGAPQIPGGGITESLQAPAQAQAAPVMAAQGGLIRLQGGGSVPDEDEIERLRQQEDERLRQKLLALMKNSGEVPPAGGPQTIPGTGEVNKDLIPPMHVPAPTAEQNAAPMPLPRTPYTDTSTQPPPPQGNKGILELRAQQDAEKQEAMKNIGEVPSAGGPQTWGLDGEATKLPTTEVRNPDNIPSADRTLQEEMMAKDKAARGRRDRWGGYYNPEAHTSEPTAVVSKGVYEFLGGPEVLEGARQGSTAGGNWIEKQHWANPAIYRDLASGSPDAFKDAGSKVAEVFTNPPTRDQLTDKKYAEILRNQSGVKGLPNLEESYIKAKEADMKALRDAAGADPTIMERVSSALGYEKKKDQAPSTVSKPDNKETPNPLLDNLKNQIAQKAPEKSFIEKLLGDNAQQKLLALTALSKHTSPYGKSMEEQAESQRKLQGTEATASAAGRTAQWNAAMTAQTQTEAELLKVETELAKSGLTGGGDRETDLNTRIQALKTKLIWLRRLTGSPAGSTKGPVTGFVEK